jgi:hypothetical protein
MLCTMNHSKRSFWRIRNTSRISCSPINQSQILERASRQQSANIYTPYRCQRNCSPLQASRRYKIFLPSSHSSECTQQYPELHGAYILFKVPRTQHKSNCPDHSINQSPPDHSISQLPSTDMADTKSIKCRILSCSSRLSSRTSLDEQLTTIHGYQSCNLCGSAQATRNLYRH